MLSVKEKGDPFVVTPVNLEISDVPLTVFIAKGEGNGNFWINAVYYNGVSIKSDDPLFFIVSNMLKKKEIQ